MRKKRFTPIEFSGINPFTRPAFIKANYEALESLLRDRRRGRVVEFEEALNRVGSKVERESDGRRPSKLRVEEGGSRGGNLPPRCRRTITGTHICLVINGICKRFRMGSGRREVTVEFVISYPGVSRVRGTLDGIPKSISVARSLMSEFSVIMTDQREHRGACPRTYR
nr:hypothetical protein [Tanacetum cinerariifolium]